MIARQELQTRLHELSETEMDTVLQFIERVSTSAIRLRILVDETSAKINQMGSLRVFDTLLLAASKSAGLAMVVLALGTIRKAVVVAVVAGAGMASSPPRCRGAHSDGPRSHLHCVDDRLVDPRSTHACRRLAYEKPRHSGLGR